MIVTKKRQSILALSPKIAVQISYTGIAIKLEPAPFLDDPTRDWILAFGGLASFNDFSIRFEYVINVAMPEWLGPA